jgi:hypothetical protein
MKHRLIKPALTKEQSDQLRHAMSDHLKSVWLVPMVALGVALFDMPYGYYGLLRVLVCGVCLYLAAKEGDGGSGWVWILGGCALLYNPIFKFHLGREIWAVVNIATIALLAAHMWRHSRAVAD